MPPTGLRLAELVAALSLATDLGTGRPMEYALRSTLLAVGLGETLGLTDRELNDVYYVSLLRAAGCTAEAHLTSVRFGDEITAFGKLAAVDQTNLAEVLGFMFHHLGKDLPSIRRARMVIAMLAAGPKEAQQVVAAHCEVAQSLADRLGLGPEVRRGLGHTFEYWNGRGLPGRIRAEEVAVAARIVHLARDVETFHAIGGLDAAVEAIRQRSGAIYDPSLAEQFRRHAPRLYQRLATPSIWQAVLEAEPGERRWISETQFDTGVEAIAHFVDLKSTYTLHHSTGGCPGIS